jgi:hypothetical protein
LPTAPLLSWWHRSHSHGTNGTIATPLPLLFLAAMFSDLNQKNKTDVSISGQWQFNGGPKTIGNY